MGNSHHLFFPKNDIAQSFSSQSEQAAHSHCPWVFAANMTVGSIAVPDIQTVITTDNLICLDIQNLRLSNPLVLPNPRGPPSL